MEGIILLIFSAALVGCILSDTSILIALTAGLILFFFYGLKKGHSLREMLRFSSDGLRTTRNILITLALVGVLTALWRLSGTIPFIVYHAAQFCHPSVILLASFLLCCLISVLMGTSFGSAATIGVICMTIANSMGIPPIYSGGAILAGVYFGDRCSPISTSALLVATLTGTDIFKNIAAMIKTAAIPFLATAVIYYALGLQLGTDTDIPAAPAVFAFFFNLHWLTLLPALLVLLLALFRIEVKHIMLCSIAAAAVIALTVQHMSIQEIFYAAVFGFHPDAPDLAALLRGGGILSMVRVLSIICISSCYAGIFSGTGFLTNSQRHITRLSRHITPFGGILVTSILTGLISCNQTLAIILTRQLCQDAEPDAGRMAIHLENTAVVVTPLIPWSIACSVVLAVISAPSAAVLLACYLYFIPLWNYAVEWHKHSRRHSLASPDVD